MTPSAKRAIAVLEQDFPAWMPEDAPTTAELLVVFNALGAEPIRGTKGIVGLAANINGVKEEFRLAPDRHDPNFRPRHAAWQRLLRASKQRVAA